MEESVSNTMTRANNPAYPVDGNVAHRIAALDQKRIAGDETFYIERCNEVSLGLTIREHFAAMAMQGVLAHNPEREAQYVAADSVAFADALIAALAQEQRK